MQIIIDIPEEVLQRIQRVANSSWGRKNLDFLELAILDGTPLPKGHGKIIDVDQFYKAFNEYLSERKSFSFTDLETILNVVTPSILKAYKETKNETDN